MAASLAFFGVWGAARIRDRNNPMSQVVHSAVESNTSLSAQSLYHQLMARHYADYVVVLRAQIRTLGHEPLPEPALPDYLRGTP